MPCYLINKRIIGHWAKNAGIFSTAQKQTAPVLRGSSVSSSQSGQLPLNLAREAVASRRPAHVREVASEQYPCECTIIFHKGMLHCFDIAVFP